MRRYPAALAREKHRGFDQGACLCATGPSKHRREGLRAASRRLTANALNTSPNPFPRLFR